MKKKVRWILSLAAAWALCMGASAEGMVSITALREQAEAMGGRWQQTFATKNGDVNVDVPIFVPDIETMPVLTLEGAKIAREQYERIIQGEKSPKAKDNEIKYEIESDGEIWEFFLGREENGLEGYEAADTLWIQRGAYRFSQGKGLMELAEPTTFHYPWMIDPDLPCIRGSDMTLREAMRIWQADIDMCFPGETFTLQPKTIVARGSTLSDKTGKGKAYVRDGYLKIQAEQLIDGVPLIGGIIHELGGSRFSRRYAATPETNRAVEKLNRFGVGVTSTLDSLGQDSRFSDEESYRTMTSLARKRTVEIADVPLAPLDAVLACIQEDIENGNIRELYSVRLGYILYANPEMTNYAWAIPRWVVEALYVTKDDEKDFKSKEAGDAKWGYEYAPWEAFYHQELLIDAQTGEMIVFTIGQEDTFRVPEMKTWSDVK